MGQSGKLKPIRTQAGKIGALKAEKLCSSLNAEQFTQILLRIDAEISCIHFYVGIWVKCCVIGYD
jgi:hypothetical protein